MSGFTVTVRPGPAMQLGGAPLTKGATVYNFSTLDSIWINSSQSVAPGNGMIVGPLGSAELSAKNDALYWACVDSGVLSPVVVSVSDDVSNMQNPEAIALATATKLLESGLPNVLLEKVVYSGVIGNGAILNFDVSQYASVTIAGAIDGIGYHQNDALGNNIDSDWLTSFDTSRINLCAETLQLFNTTAFPTTITITGSNRPVAARLDTRNNTAYGDRWIGVGGATYNAGTRTQLGQVDAYCRMQGLVWASFGCGATSKGRFELQLSNPGYGLSILCDTVADMKVSSANILYAQYLLALPSDLYRVLYYSTITDTPTSTPGVTFIQAML